VRGFTLIELIVSLAIFSIILGVGVPRINHILENQHAKGSLFTLRKAMQNARSIALNKAQETLVCPLKASSCTNDWSQPLAVFHDQNKNLKLDSTETLHFKLSNEVNHGFWQKKRVKANYIKFTPRGYAFSSATTFLYCPNSGDHQTAKQLVINFQGRIRVNSYLNNSGSPYSSLSPLSCPH